MGLLFLEPIRFVDIPVMGVYLVVIAAFLIATVLGVGLGLVAGYFGGRFDTVIMRIADVQLALPAILTALLIDGIARGILPPELQ